MVLVHWPFVFLLFIFLQKVSSFAPLFTFAFWVIHKLLNDVKNRCNADFIRRNGGEKR